jgi:hypothetical protein
MDRTLETLQEYLNTDIVINKDWLGSSDFLADVVAKYMTGKELTEGQKRGVMNTLKAKVKYEDKTSQAEYDENAEPKGSWVGKEKQRYDLILKYVSGHGTTRGFHVYNFVDRNENRFVMFSDFNRLFPHNSTTSLVEGDVFKIRATVNRHSMNTSKYNSTGPVRETVLNRPKIGEYIGNKNES